MSGAELEKLKNAVIEYNSASDAFCRSQAIHNENLIKMSKAFKEMTCILYQLYGLPYEQMPEEMQLVVKPAHPK